MKFDAWLTTSRRRLFPATPAEHAPAIALRMARGECASFQVAIRTCNEGGELTCAVQAPEAIQATIRRVGYVPLLHFAADTPEDELDGMGYLPGLVPDPLFFEDKVFAGTFETHAFWVTVRLDEACAPGPQNVTVSIRADGGDTQQLEVTVVADEAVLPARRDFRVTHWLYADAISDWYKVPLFGEPFWQALRPYLDDYVGHGADTIYVPLFTPPLDGVKRPTQLLHVSCESGDLRFDWSMVRRWIEECKAAGVGTFEWTHLFTQWGAANAIRIYQARGETGELLWPAETPALSAEYRDFLARFLPEFERFLKIEDLVPHSLFHLSDEPSGDDGLRGYRAARGMLTQLAPWMRVMDALSDVRLAEEGLVDEPVSLLPSVGDFVDRGFPAWAYFCCIPRGRYLNRLLDTPLAKVRASGWLFHRSGVKGFLHWGYNYWYRRQTTELVDPYRTADGGAWPKWPAGDPFQVYPGAAGPVDSMRWEVFAESLQDLSLLQSSGLPRDDGVLADLHSFADFPRNHAWLDVARGRLLDAVAKEQCGR